MYPYSTRELVKVSQHLSMFPHDTLAAACRDVFDFDQHNLEVMDEIVRLAAKHRVNEHKDSSFLTDDENEFQTQDQVHGAWPASVDDSLIASCSNPVVHATCFKWLLSLCLLLVIALLANSELGALGSGM